MNRKIIAIDDDETILKSYRRILTPKMSSIDKLNVSMDFSEEENKTTKKGKFRLTTALQGKQGLELAREALEAGEPFAAALIDMRMPPGWDGLETAQALRALDERIYIVIVTAYADHSADELQEALKYDVLLLRKPFVSEEIRQLANNLCISWDRDLALEQRTSEVIQASKLAAVGELATGMAHEINSPLNVISLTAYEARELLEDGEYEELPELQSRIIKQVERCTKIINHLLRFGRHDPQAMEKIYLEEVIHNAMLFYGKKLANRNITFRQEIPKNLPPLYADGNQIEQIFINLFNNSIDAMEGRKNGEITLSAVIFPEGETLEIRFADNGPGIPEKLRQKIFEPFFTTKKSGKGTGLGLSILHNIVVSHKGTLVCESEIDKGTTFVMTLPLAKKPNAN